MNTLCLNDEEREPFEVFAKSIGLNTTRTPNACAFMNGKRMEVGDYFEPTHTAWLTWNGAKAQEAESRKPLVRMLRPDRNTHELRLVASNILVCSLYGYNSAKAESLLREYAAEKGMKVVE